MDTFNQLFDSLCIPVMASCKVGGTGYLDQLKIADMTAPVMKGTDEHGRKFIALAIKGGPKKSFSEVAARRMDGIDSDGNVIGVMTFFQRYSDPKHADFWVMGSRWGLDTDVFRTSSGADLAKVETLLNKERLTIESKYSGFSWYELAPLPAKSTTTTQHASL